MVGGGGNRRRLPRVRGTRTLKCLGRIRGLVWCWTEWTAWRLKSSNTNGMAHRFQPTLAEEIRPGWRGRSGDRHQTLSWSWREEGQWEVRSVCALVLLGALVLLEVSSPRGRG